MPEGDIAIDVADGAGSSVMVLCELGGGVLCFAKINGNHRRAK